MNAANEKQNMTDCDGWTYLAIWALAVLVLAVNAPVRRRCRGTRA